ncbi:hypothetical protein FRX31_027673, partial [Thalictrum thalictroides]
MNLPIQIPLHRIQQRINKVELTQIDRFLNNEQKKRVARFYREEAAKRTRYNLEPGWTIPASIQLIKIHSTKPE